MSKQLLDIQYAKSQDSKDLLIDFRQKFHIPIDAYKQRRYFCGHSLGLQPKKTEEYVLDELLQWKNYAVKGHFEGKHPWLPYHEFITPLLTDLVGGKNNEVICMNSLTTNLHLMMVSFYAPNKTRYKILIEQDAFPSDRYAVQSQLLFHGFAPEEALIELKPRLGEQCLRTEDILNTIEQHQHELALILLPGVQYFTGQVLPIETITKKSHEYQITIGFDLAHAVGNINLKLNQWQVDFACWCHYKYLNSGPGAVGGCFIHEQHVNNQKLKKFSGWWGHDKQTRFKMPSQFKAIPTAESWQLSNPPILSLCAIRASLEIFQQASLIKLINKSKNLTLYLRDLINETCAGKVQIITPLQDGQGCQLSLRFVDKQAEDIVHALDEQGFDVDYRHPDVIRVAPVPLYNSYEDVWHLVNSLKNLV